MNRAAPIVIVALAVSSLFPLVVACDVSAAPNDETSADPVPSAPTSAPTSGTKTTPAPPPNVKPDSGTSGTSSSSGGAADGGKPGPDPVEAACFAKCVSDNPQGFDEFGAILVPCACDQSVCGAVCGTSCGGTAAELLATTSAACGECVNDSLALGAACSKAELFGCLTKPKCPGFAICAQGCQ